MKKALLWLGPLACLALACLYAYAWFTRDARLVEFERISVGMTCRMKSYRRNNGTAR